VRPRLRLVWLAHGQTLHEAGVNVAHLYFPVTAVIAYIVVLNDGDSAEVALVGNEGVAGVAILLGSSTTPATAVVQSAGWAYQIRSSAVQEEVARNGNFLWWMLRYAQAFITQVTVTAACNRHHSIEQQLCRWLLLTCDRRESNNLTITQEVIAGLLGVRREGVTEAAGRLRQVGVIKYSRGKISVLNRAGLEVRSCECYSVVRMESDRLLGQPQGVHGEVPNTATAEMAMLSQQKEALGHEESSGLLPSARAL
jgi:CRP-like cAMP-binding protein